jgi:hypothetical protein
MGLCLHWEVLCVCVPCPCPSHARPPARPPALVHVCVGRAGLLCPCLIMCCSPLPSLSLPTLSSLFLPFLPLPTLRYPVSVLAVSVPSLHRLCLCLRLCLSCLSIARPLSASGGQDHSVHVLSYPALLCPSISLHSLLYYNLTCLCPASSLPSLLLCLLSTLSLSCPPALVQVSVGRAGLLCPCLVMCSSPLPFPLSPIPLLGCLSPSSTLPCLVSACCLCLCLSPSVSVFVSVLSLSLSSLSLSPLLPPTLPCPVLSLPALSLSLLSTLPLSCLPALVQVSIGRAGPLYPCLLVLCSSSLLYALIPSLPCTLP